MKMCTIITTALLMTIVCWIGTRADCVYKGVSYPEGKMVTGNPCDYCTCTETGKAACAIIDCFYPFFQQFCPDGSLPTRKEGQCCSVCNVTSTIQGQ